MPAYCLLETPVLKSFAVPVAQRQLCQTATARPNPAERRRIKKELARVTFGAL